MPEPSNLQLSPQPQPHLQNQNQPQPQHQPQGILPAIQSLVYVLIVALFLLTFTVQPIRIPSSSMEPTLLVGDFLLLDKPATALHPGWALPPAPIRRGAIIVFHDPVGDPAVHLVKRVIGLPGDRLHLRNGAVYLNGSPLPELYAQYNPSPYDSFRDDFPSLLTLSPGVDPNWWAHLRTLVHDGDITVPPNQFFVMGDNRNNSEDSRFWGFVPRSAIVGEPFMVYFSFQQPNESVTPHPAARWNRTFHIVH